VGDNIASLSHQYALVDWAYLVDTSNQSKVAEMAPKTSRSDSRSGCIIDSTSRRILAGRASNSGTLKVRDRLLFSPQQQG